MFFRRLVQEMGMDTAWRDYRINNMEPLVRLVQLAYLCKQISLIIGDCTYDTHSVICNIIVTQIF